MNIREAGVDDRAEASELILLTLGDSGSVLFGNGSEEGAKALFEELFSSRGSRFSHQYAYSCEVEHKVVGLLVAFPGRMMLRLMLNTGFQMLKNMGVLNFLVFLLNAFPLRNEENVHRSEFFISHLAVFPEFQRKGIGMQLLEFAQRKARNLGLSKLALNTDMDNVAAISLYKKFGFNIVSRTKYPESTCKKLGSRGSYKLIINLLEE